MVNHIPKFLKLQQLKKSFSHEVNFFHMNTVSSLRQSIPKDNSSKIKCFKIIFQKLESWRSLFVCAYASKRVISWFQFCQLGLFCCSQECLQYFKTVDYRNTRQSKKINFIFWYRNNIHSRNKLIYSFQQSVLRHTQSSLSCNLIIFKFI